jgi:hypothetical protein
VSRPASHQIDELLTAGETISDHASASRVVSMTRSVAGDLYLTNTRLIWIARHWERSIDERSLAWKLNGLREVGVRQRDKDYKSFGFRKRLEVTLSKGGGELFIIRHVDEWADRIDAARGR